MEDFNRIMIRGAAVPTLIAGLGATVVAWFVGGSPAATGAAIGTVIVLGFFMVGQLVLASVLRKNPAMGFSIAMLLYLIKIGVLLALLLLLQGVTAFDTRAFAFTILLCTLVWTSAEAWVIGKSKVLVVTPNEVPEGVQKFAEDSSRTSQQ